MEALSPSAGRRRSRHPQRASMNWGQPWGYRQARCGAGGKCLTLMLCCDK